MPPFDGNNHRSCIGRGRTRELTRRLRETLTCAGRRLRLRDFRYLSADLITRSLQPITQHCACLASSCGGVSVQQAQLRGRLGRGGIDNEKEEGQEHGQGMTPHADSCKCRLRHENGSLLCRDTNLSPQRMRASTYASQYRKGCTVHLQPSR
jgi:hypothetical protein